MPRGGRPAVFREHLGLPAVPGLLQGCMSYPLEERVERVVERVRVKSQRFGCSGGTLVWHRCR